MEEQDQIEKIDQEEIIVEKEWVRIERLLSYKHSTAFNMAVVEADKLFREVLGIISYGETVDEAIQNASDMYSDMKGLLEVRKVYEDIIEVPDFWVNKDTAKQVTAIYLQAILDMMGKDYQERGAWQRFWNDMIYFSESHPRLLRNIVVGALIFLVVVWILTDTVPGQWLVRLIIGLTHFILNWVWWLVLILLVVLAIATISWLFLEQRKKR